jgi:hypothetical protein
MRSEQHRSAMEKILASDLTAGVALLEEPQRRRPVEPVRLNLG